MTAAKGLYRNEIPLREIIAAKIRDRIVTGVFQPGERLVERDLAAEFEVSRSPVREAIRILHQEGFVENLATRGIVVKRMERREVEELFDLREALESLASRLAAERVGAETGASLHHRLRDAESAFQAGNLDAAHEANTGFHDDIIVLSGNRNLQDMLRPLMGRLHWIFRQISDFSQVRAEHELLCAAIESGDPERAAEAARSHVLSYRRQTLEHLFD